MSAKKKYELTRLQGAMAIASFSAGTVICMVCLFFVPPYGEISSTAMMAVSEFLVLCGGLLGAKASFDMRMQRFEARVMKEIRSGEIPGQAGNDEMLNDENNQPTPTYEYTIRSPLSFARRSGGLCLRCCPTFLAFRDGQHPG